MLVWYGFPDGAIRNSQLMSDKWLKTSGSPVLFLYNILYSNKEILEGMIPHLLNVDEMCRALLGMVLCKYQDVFPGMLPTHALSNWKLGDLHEIPLMEGAKLVRKSMYRHSP